MNADKYLLISSSYGIFEVGIAGNGQASGDQNLIIQYNMEDFAFNVGIDYDYRYVPARSMDSYVMVKFWCI